MSKKPPKTDAAKQPADQPSLPVKAGRSFDLHRFGDYFDTWAKIIGGIGAVFGLIAAIITLVIVSDSDDENGGKSPRFVNTTNTGTGTNESANGPKPLTPEAREELRALATILNSMEATVARRNNIVVGIEDYVKRPSVIGWRNVLRIATKLEDSIRRIDTHRKNVLDRFLLEQRPTFGQLNELIQKTEQVVAQLKALRFPHTRSQIAILQRIANDVRQLIPRLKNVGRDIEHFLRDQR